MSHVWSFRLRRLHGLAIAVLLTTSAGCGGSPGLADGGGDDLNFTIGLINGDVLLGNPIHLFGPGEDFPCCRVDQLSNRDYFETAKVGDKLTFRAGRSGEILKTVECTVRDGDGKIVRWTPTSTGSDTGTLTCHTGW